MQIKSIIASVALALSVTSCSMVQKWVYRIDVPQGNYLEAAQVEQVKAGMTYAQVQYLLGTPLLTDPYNGQTLYYVFLQQKSYEDPVQHTFTVHLNSQGVVTDTHLDKPLPEDNDILINNDIITETAIDKERSWWKFWK
ncbi:Beta-barrel assembly machine subunit BamE [Cricetibacter osteomyelitidis]|uniref:Outer membrane protein assembly factor BamE n=1 Tax=Cricetibacter osteomyelitidis TaxID=1521931 RepID=A0A4R2TCW6_9PAST|nr:outer membrane protein assembly factor BamE [Cricetibacter osteomyelitidis]TCP94948.1 Beta-barrel assembly machine subunit BamE [Cricetibacter osteomyelitidis]